MKQVIIDLENTLSDSRHRMFLLELGDEQEEFQLRFKDDKVNHNVKFFMKSLMKKGYAITILTAKIDSYRDMVVDWLKENDISYHYLVMKPEDSKQNSLEFKESYVLDTTVKISFALNDVGAECAMFEKYNIPCLRIEQK